MCMHIIIMHMHAYDCMRLQIGWVGEMGGWEDGGMVGGQGGYISLSLTLSNYFVSRRELGTLLILCITAP